jgi:DNA-binding PadR family transcriptional regulator
MDTIEKRPVGLGMFTQYCVLKFIEEKEPNELLLLRFVNANYSHFFPPSGTSINKYLDDLLFSGYIQRGESGKISLMEKGKSQLDHLKIYSEEMAVFENNLGINYAIA